jgi:hypothetical protein
MLSSIYTGTYDTDDLKKPRGPSGLSELWCGIHTAPVLRCFVNSEGLNCEDLLEGVVPELTSWLMV